MVRRKLELSGPLSTALGVVALVLAAATVTYMLTGKAPWHGDTRTLVFVLAGMLATYGVNHLWRRREALERALEGEAALEADPGPAGETGNDAQGRRADDGAPQRPAPRAAGEGPSDRHRARGE